jgi:hypothetical protein
MPEIIIDARSAGAWLAAGFDAAGALEWLLNGVEDPFEARRWRRLGFTPGLAAAYRAEGVTDPAHAYVLEYGSEPEPDLLDVRGEPPATNPLI